MRALGIPSTLLALLCLAAPSARAQVTEPNGTVVPVVDPDNFETDLVEFFGIEGEAIDPVAEANPEPGVFSPQCDFEAALVLSESSAAAGLSWYNVPQDPTEIPAEVYEILPVGTAMGGVAQASEIRAHPAYAGGLVGFVLMKDFGRVYYSEYQRNADCTGCQNPGHWVMMLAYRSTSRDSTYYLTFEDWEGANDTTWYENDGDFNDKVFRVTGISCAGGGEPCETGKLGLCGAGLTECQPGGTLVCRQQTPETPEACDEIDNDCNGLVDDGDLCPPDEVCLRGRCVGRCSTGEFRCPPDLECGNDGYCIDPACLDVICEPGTLCVGGECRGACNDVVCPLGLSCQLGRCVDLCANVTCDPGTFCDRGVCVGDCSCNGCPQGKACGREGRCVEPGCETLSCGQGEGCLDGACVDACTNAVCPGDAPCAGGLCQEPAGVGGLGSSGGSGGASIEPSTGGVTIDPTAGGSTGSGATSNGATGNAGPPSVGATGSGARTGAPESDDSGCGCRLVGPTARGLAGVGGLFLGLGLALGQRVRRSRRRPPKGACRT